MINVREACIEAVRSYTSQATVRTPVLFIRSTDFSGRENKARHLERWTELAANGLEVAEVESSHKQMLIEPNVGLVAEAIRSSIETLLPRTGGNGSTSNVFKRSIQETANNDDT